MYTFAEKVLNIHMLVELGQAVQGSLSTKDIDDQCLDAGPRWKSALYRVPTYHFIDGLAYA